MNKFTISDCYWPTNEFFVEDLCSRLYSVRQDTKTYLQNSELYKVQESIRNIKNTVCGYYNIRSRSKIRTFSKRRTFVVDQMEVEEYILQLINDSTTRFFVAKLCGTKPVKAVVGIHGTNEDAGYFLDILDHPIRNNHETAVGFLKPLVKAGYLVLCPDLPFHGEDYPDQTFKEDRFGTNICEVDTLSRLCGHSYTHETIHRMMGLADLILSGMLGDINTLGIVGFSLGGSCATAIASCDERFTSVANLMGISTYEKFLKNKPWQILSSTYTLGAGFLSSVGDTWNLAAAICSRPIFITACTKDDHTDYEGVLDIREIIEILYTRYGAKYYWSDFDQEHNLNEAMANQLISWFEDTL